LKTDKENGNTRIATGEYFPNTFWGAVKQRSRWLAGIVFQNWKIHGWKGSAKTKYTDGKVLLKQSISYSEIENLLSHSSELLYLTYVLLTSLSIQSLYHSVIQVHC